MGRLKQIGIDVEVHRLIEQHRRTFSESVNDILGRILPSISLATPVPAPAPARPSTSLSTGSGSRSSIPSGARNRGQWTVVIEGRRIAAGSLKAAYRALLVALNERSPDFLANFAEEKGRSRRFVARTPGGLYGASPHLAKYHAEALCDGWFFDTNLSAAQVSARARIAARLCGLHYGSQVKLLENLREI